MKIIITGCAGFIGINFTKYWLDRHDDDEVIGIDALTYAANTAEITELADSCKRFRFYHEDICNADSISHIFEAERPEFVVNFAAESHVDRSISDADIFIRSNVLGVQVLLDACLASGARFHQISTDEVYGDLPLDSNEKFTEESILKPSSPYSASKAAADLLALAYHRTHGLPVTISRSSNNYGRYQHSEKMIPHSIERLLGGLRAEVYGDGKNVRDWIHVLDHCQGIEAVLLRGRIGEIYNIGGGFEISNIALIRRIINTLGLSDSENSLIELVSDRKGHDRRYSLDTSKIERELGWRAEINFDDGLKDTVSFIKSTI